jgi:hypothetical protein
MLWSAATGAQIGADWLAARIAPAGEFGRRARESEPPFRPGDERKARALLERVDRIAQTAPPATLGSLHGALAAAPDPNPIVARARAGAVLADVDFFELLRFFDALAEIGRLAAEGGFRKIPLGRPARELRSLLSGGRTPARAFYLASSFEPALERARGEAAAMQAAFDAARSRLAADVARQLGRETLAEGEFVVMRDTLDAPLPGGLRVLREAPTYLLCELMLDDAALAALAARNAAATAVAEEEEAVRTRLSQAVAGAAEELARATDALGEIDSLAARVHFAQRYAAALPEIGPEGRLTFEDARFLPLEAILRERGHRYATISLQLDRVGVLTGPNMGGKTAALRTCGFVAACVALGVPVPARSASVPLFDEIVWIGLGSGPEDEGLLSAFGREVIELREFFERTAPRPLVLIDEFARTTSPREGRALLVALLEVLQKRGACALAATHLAHVAEVARVGHYAIAGLRELPARDGAEALELDAALERIARVMDYSIARVGESDTPHADALALADVLGLDSELIARARAAL